VSIPFVIANEVKQSYIRQRWDCRAPVGRSQRHLC